MAGRSPAGELAGVAGITPQTASSHLARLATARLLTVAKQGRHRYHRLATPEVARMLEGIMQIASESLPEARRKLLVGPRNAAMRRARTCYDHFAGRLGVAIADGLIARSVIEFGDDAGLVTEQGIRVLRDSGINLPGTATARPRSARPLCRPCLDWSERRPHVAGKLGTEIFAHYLAKSLVRRIEGSRALDITQGGRTALRDMFGITDLE